MKNILILSSILALAGCASNPIAVKMNNPYDFPPTLLENCKEPEFLNPEAKLSENLKVMIDNNVKSAEIRISKKALAEMIQKRKEIFDATNK